jgi:hypothetical protein
VANRVYARELRRHHVRVGYGIETHVDPYVDAAEARAHLEWLSAQGVGRRAVSQATGLSQSHLVKIRTGQRQRITPDTEARVLAVGTHRRRPRSLVDIDKAQLLIDDLLVIGYTKAAIAQALGAQTPALQVYGRITAGRMARLVEVHRLLVATHEVHHGTLSGHMRALVALTGCPAPQRRAAILRAWDSLGPDERFLFNKLITGGFRMGVSQGLMTRALAQATGLEQATLAHRLMGDWTPAGTSYARLIAADDPAAAGRRPYPFALASPLEDPPEALGDPADWLAEWKWDGLRGQLIRRPGTQIKRHPLDGALDPGNKLFQVPQLFKIIHLILTPITNQNPGLIPRSSFRRR